MKFFRSAEEKQHGADVEAAFRAVMGRLSAGDPAQTMQLVATLNGDAKLASLSDKQRRQLSEQAVAQYASAVLADDHLTEDEEDALASLAEAVGFEQEDFQQHDLYTRLQVAKLNAGRLPVVASPNLMAKRSEIVHLETSAALMTEVAVREWRGGSSGVSFRVAKGVRYHVGSTRGQMVTVGSQLQLADSGMLAVTSQRVIFLGSRKTVEMPYSKLLGMHLFSDGISFSLSNRQNAPMIRVAMNTEVLVALINAAAQPAQG